LSVVSCQLFVLLKLSTFGLGRVPAQSQATDN
jgi:hypothetical protein